MTPADGTTGVATNSSVVFVFDQDMNTQVVPYGTFTPALVGNFAFEPTGLFITGTWGADKRTLTIKPIHAMPYDTAISWTLNPPAGMAFPPFSSASGELLPTSSGGFRTAPYIAPIPPPKVISITPTNAATQTSPHGSLVFTFDQAMDTTTPLQATTNQMPGNYVFTPVGLNAVFTGSWSVDKRTLTFTPSGPIPFGTTVFWNLNPNGTTTPIKNTTGQVLAPVSGNYQIIADSGGSPSETCSPPIVTGGRYTLTKIQQHIQTNAIDVVPSDTALSSFSVTVVGPPSGKGGNRSLSVGTSGTVTNVSITFPDSHETTLELSAGAFQFSDSLPEPQLETAYPSGRYTLRIDQEGKPESVVNLDMPPAPVSVPKIANYPEAQTIDPARDFTLRWNAFFPQAAGAFLELRISDESGKLIFQAPNSCVPRALGPAETSTVIPANYLRAGLNYRGVLRFGLRFYTSTTDVPEMVGTGVVQQTTSFIIGTVGSTGIIASPEELRPKFTTYRLLANGHPELTLSATSGQTYSILRSDTLTAPKWILVGSARADLSGSAIFEDGAAGSRRLGPSLTFPAFYRAVGQ